MKSVGNEITFGGVTVNASKDFQTQLLLSVNTEDLSVNYIKSLTSVANKSGRFVIQNKSVQYLNGYVYFTGLLNGSWKQESESENIATNHTSAQLKGYVLKMNPETGKVEKLLFVQMVVLAVSLVFMKVQRNCMLSVMAWALLIVVQLLLQLIRKLMLLKLLL